MLNYGLVIKFMFIILILFLRFQKKLCVVNILLIIASLATVCAVAFMQKDCDLIGSLTYFNVLPIVAIVFLLLAHKGISHDQKLLRGSSRIR